MQCVVGIFAKNEMTAVEHLADADAADLCYDGCGAISGGEAIDCMITCVHASFLLPGMKAFH